MPAIVVRNLSDETHRALKARAKAHGHSTEAEVRQILSDAVLPEDQLGFGTQIANIAAEVGGFDLDFQRDTRSTEPIDFT